MKIQSFDPVVVFMTAPTAGEASQIADMLVSKRLAACVQVLPEIKSTYVWKGEVRCDTEALILAKTRQDKFADLEREVRAIHSYETPEIIAMRIDAGSAPYLNWLASCLEGS